MAPNPDYVYCTICGMALRGDAVVLSGPHWSGSDAPLSITDQDITRYEAEAESYPGKLFLVPDREQVYPQHAYAQPDAPPGSAPAKMYLGIHAACEGIANRIMERSLNAKIRSIADLWLTLERRCARYLRQGRGQGPPPRDMNYIPCIPNNQLGQPLSLGYDRYYVPKHCLDQWGDEWEGWWDEEPVKLPDLTTQLMSNLEQVSDESSTAETDASEINHHVRSFFQNNQISTECTYTLPQSVWREIFLRIPLLWDLETTVMDAKFSLDNINKWNWEKLARQTMTSPHPSPENAASYRDEGVWSYEEVGLDVPGGFANRRRIWKILEEMYPNDVQA